ncbi:protein zwilch homolog [Myxocyprinus asiaticus]|uniref:protein zwilch homolog n=1 Tax=Myxocyprinus asiaticus TaxID=70543 RepID=UPI00222249B3|nr:protein zwilch homolog [Myxocyprinus asiaticus]
MLLDLGLNMIRKDFINYLSYYLDTEVELQEQVIRVRKLYHLLEIMGTCSTFLNLPHDCLFSALSRNNVNLIKEKLR